MIKGFRAALGFLTVLPVGPGPLGQVGTDGQLILPRNTTVMFPVVGLVIGVVLLGFGWWMPSGMVSTALILTLWTVLTGGLHEDGWMDSADAALPSLSQERRVEILRDPRVGAFGATALVFGVLIRFSAVAEGPLWALLLAPIAGRWMMVLSLAWGRPLRSSGLGASFAQLARPWAATLVAVGLFASAAWVAQTGTLGLLASPTIWLPAEVASVAGPWLALVATVASVAIVSLGLSAYLTRRLGGLNGDGHGAIGFAAESTFLVVTALLHPLPSA